nr:MAG: hypothetical protein DIU68_14490 [Chloroflexota bacterium]
MRNRTAVAASSTPIGTSTVLRLPP